MDLNSIANRAIAALGLDVQTPPFAAVACALVNPISGAIGGKVDQAGNFVPTSGGRNQYIAENFTAWDTNDAVSVIQPSGAARATTTALVHHMYSPGGFVYGLANIGVQTTSPVMAATGLDIRGVETNAIGSEIFTHGGGGGISGRPFIIGKDPGFFMRVSLTVEDISGCTVLLAGFRRAEVNNVTYTSYADYAALGIIASAATGAINIAAENDGSGSPTDTTMTWADTATKTFEVRVDAAGNVTFLVNGSAPTVSAAATFDDGDPICPFLHFIQHTDVAGLITLNSWEVGFLP